MILLMQNKLLTSREINWLGFNARVLQEADDPTVPLMERIRFLAIYSNNLDEFFRVRVPVLKKIKKSVERSVRRPRKILEQVVGIVRQQQTKFNRIWKRIIEELKKEKVFLINDKHLDEEQKAFVRDYFDREVSSSIIPLFIEDMAKLPAFGDENIFLGIVMQRRFRDRTFALIEIPTKIHSRFVLLPAKGGEQRIMLLEDLVRFNLPRIFGHLGYKSFKAYMFKVTKDAEIDIDNDISTSFIQKIEKGLKNRRKAKTIRFQYDKQMDQELLAFLIHKLHLTYRDSIIPGGPIRNFRDFMHFPARLHDGDDRPQPFKHPLLAESLRVSDVVMRQDVLLHFPYHTFNSIIDLLREAAMDPDVKSIKITAYRLAPASKICNALINAARNGKKVHVVLELRAYSDEEANLHWKARLEDEGVKVSVGIPQMKVHAKICVVKKRMGNQMRQYGFIGTGNLNEETALRYIDLYLLTSDPAIMADVDRIFTVLENPQTKWNQLALCKTLLVSPVNMRKEITKLIDREIKAAKSGSAAKMTLLLNSVTDEKLIKKLEEAASAGVEMKLIIRSVFCADSPKMRAISIVDEFLEHARILLFYHGGKEEIYLSSADWMVRNLDYRIEVAVPIRDEVIKNELKHILKIKWSDNVKARWLDRELSNQYVTGPGLVRSQVAVYEYLKRKRLPS